VKLKSKNGLVKHNLKLVHKNYRFSVRASEQTGLSPQNQENSGVWAQIPRKRFFLFGLFRRSHRKSETLLWNQLPILFHECGLRFSRSASEDPLKLMAGTAHGDDIRQKYMFPPREENLDVKRI